MKALVEPRTCQVIEGSEAMVVLPVNSPCVPAC